MERLLFGVEEAAESLNISRTRVFAEMSAGRLRSVKCGRRRLITREAIDDYVKQLADVTSEDAGAA